MTQIEFLLSKLPSAKRQGNQWVARCPGHNDERPSLGIREGDDGRVLIHCHAGCPPEQILAKLDMKMSDLMPNTSLSPSLNPKLKATATGPATKTTPSPTRKPLYFVSAETALDVLERKKGKVSAQWRYQNKSGETVGIVARWDLADGKKDIRPISKAENGWVIGAMAEPRPLYYLPDLLKMENQAIFVVEGEKAADAAKELGFMATTSAGGAMAAGKSDWTILAGRSVVILPDADEAGEKYAADVLQRLRALNPPASVRILRLPGLDESGDVFDYTADQRAEGMTDEKIKSKILTLLEATPAETLDIPAPEPSELQTVEYGPILLNMAEVQSRPVNWLWSGRIARGCIMLLAGRPGEGKSFLTLDMAARVSTGTSFPDGAKCPLGSVILISCEDDPGYTIKPRLEALRADCSRIKILKGKRCSTPNGGAVEVMFTLSDIHVLKQAITSMPDCALVVVDPIGSFLGGDTDSYRDNEVRAVLAPVAKLAERYGVAVVVVAHHRKSASAHADDMAMGSRGFTGLARTVYHVLCDEENKRRRLFLPGKNNLAVEGDGLAFTITGDPAAIIWEPDPVAMTADEAMEIRNGDNKGGGRRGPSPEKRNQAVEWLSELLSPGPMASAIILDEGKAAGFPSATLYRAKDEIGIKPYKDKFSGKWYWKLPEPTTRSGQSGQSRQTSRWSRPTGRA